MKLVSVQYLRAVAALLVVAYHTNNMGLLRPHFAILGFGGYGVDLFFVISGFIIAVTTARNISPGVFFRRRLIRIVPLYWLITSVYVLIALIAPTILRSRVLDLHHIFLSFFFVPHYHPNFPDVIWPVVIPGWSLNYELFFYALFGCALFLSASYRAGLTIISLGLLVLAGQYLSSTNPIIVTYTNGLLLEFILGIIVGEVFLLAKPAYTSAVFVLFLLSTGIIAACCIAGVTIGRPFVYGIPSACLLSFLISLEQWKLLFSSTILVAVGDASYSIYLTHPAVIGAIRHIGDELKLDGSHPAEGLLALVAALIVSSYLGWLLFVLFERPTTRTLNSFFGRRASRQTPATGLRSTESINS